MEDRQSWLAKRAYELWEHAGRPDGADQVHWEQALMEWDAQTRVRLEERSDWDDEDEEREW